MAFKQRRQSDNTTRNILIAILVVLVITGVSVGVFFAVKSRQKAAGDVANVSTKPGSNASGGGESDDDFEDDEENLPQCKDVYIGIGNTISQDKFNVCIKNKKLSGEIQLSNRHKVPMYVKSEFIFYSKNADKFDQGESSFRMYTKEGQILKPETSEYIKISQDEAKLRDRLSKYLVGKVTRKFEGYMAGKGAEKDATNDEEYKKLKTEEEKKAYIKNAKKEARQVAKRQVDEIMSNSGGFIDEAKKFFKSGLSNFRADVIIKYSEDSDFKESKSCIGKVDTFSLKLQ